MRPPTLVIHPADTLGHKAIPPLVAHSCARSHTPAQRAKILPVLIALVANSALLFIRFEVAHGIPDPFRSRRQPVTYVLNQLCYLCLESAPPDDVAPTRVALLRGCAIAQGSRTEVRIFRFAKLHQKLVEPRGLS